MNNHIADEIFLQSLVLLLIKSHLDFLFVLAGSVQKICEQK